MTDALLAKLTEAFKPDLFVNHYGSSEIYTFTVNQNAANFSLSLSPPARSCPFVGSVTGATGLDCEHRSRTTWRRVDFFRSRGLERPSLARHGLQ